jgi:hypothetical protein
MKANKTHISLETAKLLNDCEVESKHYWSGQLQKIITKEQFESYDPYNQDKLQDDSFRQAVETTYKIYTWQEILWENAEKFFGKEVPKYLECSEKILRLLQQEKYDEADEYFRDKCVKEMPQFKGTWKKLNDLTIIK